MHKIGIIGGGQLGNGLHHGLRRTHEGVALTAVGWMIIL